MKKQYKCEECGLQLKRPNKSGVCSNCYYRRFYYGMYAKLEDVQKWEVEHPQWKEGIL